MKDLKFVDIGEGITEGRILKWLVNDNDTVKEDQALVQIETDKAVVNIPAPISGSIRINAKTGSTVNVGDVLAYIGTASEIAGVSANANTSPATPKITADYNPIGLDHAKQDISTNANVPPNEVLATPRVRKLAEELKIDLSKINGTGPHGRITEADLKQQNSRNATPVPSVSRIDNSASVTPAGGLTERIPMSQTRKAIARNMEASWTIPRASHMDLANATYLYNLTEKEKDSVKKSLNIKLSFLPFMIKAAIEALKENPNFNASYDKEKQEIIVKRYYNIGLAAEAKDGLKVVVIRDADKKSIIELAREIDTMHKKILDNTISINEMSDSTFTITNIGSLGGGFLSVPMINYPNVAILGVHLIRRMPIVEGDEIKIGMILPFTLTFDHRVVDGAEAVKFGNAFKRYIEDPEFLEML
ncbi:MAG: 2-oxo acid dehydrogenase subunit E2 [Candidatus Marsarchaeota archaeon]|nr:2-oxo acid dehydrogenase subunit E2 [Candidatus Marsarchaeota archaeon]